MSSVGVAIDVDIFDAEKAAGIDDEFGTASKLVDVALVEVDRDAIVALFRNEDLDFDVAGATISVV